MRPDGSRVKVYLKGFQSTHSLRSATISGQPRPIGDGVSIHALLAECDVHFQAVNAFPIGFNPRTPCGVRPVSMMVSTLPVRGFNPRTPCGVRLYLAISENKDIVFQSTHSLRSATAHIMGAAVPDAVSIHALLAECDLKLTEALRPSTSFNPRTPCGVRLPISVVIIAAPGFNPRTPCGVRLRPTLYIATQQSKSYFAPTSLKRPSLHGCSF